MKLKKLAFSISLLICFSIQVGLQLHHSFEEHYLHLCDNDNVEHMCDFENENHEHYFDVYLNLPLHFNYQPADKIDIITVDDLNEGFVKNHQKLSFSLRAPPYYSFV